MKRFKRLAALFMAVAMLMTCAATTAVAAEKNVWVDFDWDAPEEISTSTSINHLSSSVSHMYTLSSPTQVASITATAKPNAFDATFSIEIESSTHDGNHWLTDFWVASELDFPSLDAADVDKTISAVITATLTNGQSKTTDYVVTLDDMPMFQLTKASRDLIYKGLTVGQSINLTSEPLDKAGVLAGKTINYKWELKSGTAFAKLESVDNTATLTGLATGKARFQLNGQVDGIRTVSTTYSVNVTGTYVPPAGPALDGAKDDLAAGNDAALDVKPNEGLSASDLLDLKNTATGGAKVELTFNNDDDLKLSFDPAAIPDNWSGEPFTPAFTPEMPEAAKKEGFVKTAGKWLDFNYSGPLPAPMTVTMKVAPGTYPDGTTELKVWYFDPATKALVEQPLEVVYDAATGTVTFTLNHFSTYLICADGVDPNENKVPVKPPVVDSGVRDSGDSSEDDSNSPESLRLVAEQTTWNKTFAALASEDSLMALPSGTAVINGQTVTAPMLTFNTDEVKQIPAFVVDRLAGKNALLKFTGKGITDSFVHGAMVQPTAGNRIFYRVADFLALYAPQE